MMVLSRLHAAFHRGADFLFYLVWEVSVLSFVFHNDFLINSRLGRKSKGKMICGYQITLYLCIALHGLSTSVV